MKMIYGVKDRPKLPELLVFSLQQLLAIMAATLVVPVIVGHGMSTAAALFGAGVGTFVYLLFTKFKSPVFLGSSFAFIGSMSSAFAGAVSTVLGYLGLIIGAVFAGLVYVIIALVVKFAGVKWINKLMPVVVIGPTVAIIGLSLAGNAVSDLQTVNYSVPDGVYESVDGSYVLKDKKGDIIDTLYTDDEGNLVSDSHEINVTEENGKIVEVTTSETHTTGSVYVAIICGLITLAVVMVSSVYGKKMFKLIPFIIGILAGYLSATIFYFIGDAIGNDALKIINFDAFKGLQFFKVPDFTFMTAKDGIKELTKNPSYIASIAVAYVPVAFVVFAEHIADHKNLSSIIEKDLLEDPGLHRTLLGDGVGSIFGAFFGGCPNTTYGESVGCVAITKNASVYSIVGCAALAIIISFFGPFIAFVNSIPSCVMGGVCMALYGFIAVSGLKMIKDVDLDDNRNLFVVSVILISGIGGLAVSFGDVTLTTTAVSLILGILANLLLSRKKDENEQ